MAENRENPFGDIPFSEARGSGGKFEFSRKERVLTFSHPQKDCDMNCGNMGAKVECGHYFCPDCLLNWAWSQVASMKVDTGCGYCGKVISIGELIKFGMPSKEETLHLTTAITTNFYMSQDINNCPKCETVCCRKSNDSVQVQCTICPTQGNGNFSFCWYCLRTWKNPRNIKECGNEDCRREEIELLVKSPMKSYGGVKFPVMRACPNLSCSTLNSHKDECPITTCKRCTRKFCFVCLTMGSDGSFACKRMNRSGVVCSLAPPQIKIYQ